MYAMTSDAPVNPFVKPIVIDGQTGARLCSTAVASVASFASPVHVNDVLNLTLIKNLGHSVEFCSMYGHLETQCQSVLRISVTIRCVNYAPQTHLRLPEAPCQ